jgi:hypothetical protein
VRDSRRRGGPGIRHLIGRRDFLRAAAALLLAPAARAQAPALEQALETSPFVYVSPLRSDGSESRCHAEVWFGWMDGAVWIITGARGWKARALAAGLARARLWVGDLGRWKALLSSNDDFRRAPSFVARASVVHDEARLERLLGIYQRKYPEESSKWLGRMRSGYADGSRVLIRYAPEGGASAPRT